MDTCTTTLLSRLFFFRGLAHQTSDNEPLEIGMLNHGLFPVLVSQVVKSLTRAQNLSVRTQHAELLSQRVLVAEDSLCRGCHKPLGNRVFHRYPSGMLLCNSCVSSNEDQRALPSS